MNTPHHSESSLTSTFASRPQYIADRAQRRSIRTSGRLDTGVSQGRELCSALLPLLVCQQQAQTLACSRTSEFHLGCDRTLIKRYRRVP